LAFMGARKGPPPVPSNFSFEHDGDRREFGKYISAVTGRVTAIAVERFDFRLCPICLEPDPDVAEHVPPESLNGRIMTMTCRRCNHDFGTAEDQLRSFIALETTAYAQASEGSVKGRRAAKVALRSSEDGATGVFVRSAAPEFDEVLKSGSGALTFKPLDMPLVVAAGLKHAYLAACLHQQAVPESDDVDRVREVLLAARDRNRGALMNALGSLGFEPMFGLIEAKGGPQILLLETAEDDPHWLFLFGGLFAFQWPFRDVKPRAAELGPDASAMSLDDPPH
jgi:hypothetical protein